MTPQEYNDIKILVTRKEWKTYCKFLDNEILKLTGLEPMKGVKSKEELWDLRNKVLGIEFTVSVALQAVDDFENEKGEKK